MIKDSGDRTQFETGAVRDMHGGKGRCDLLPLGTISKLHEAYINKKEISTLDIFDSLDGYITTKNAKYIENAILEFIQYRWESFEDAMLELAKHYEDGCRKYGQNNWRKGIPTHCYIDSAVRHYLKHQRGDKDECHDRAFIWNLVCLLWTIENKPEMDDINPEEYSGEQ